MRHTPTRLAQAAGTKGVVGMGVGRMAVTMLMAVPMLMRMAVGRVSEGQGHAIALASAGAFPLA